MPAGPNSSRTSKTRSPTPSRSRSRSSGCASLDLRELIEDERKLVESRGLLAVKKKEYERLTPLARRDAVSKVEFEKLALEIEALQVRVNETERIKNWISELERLDKSVGAAAGAGAKKTGSFLFQQIYLKKLDGEVRLIGLNEDISQIQQTQKAKRARLDQVLTLQKQAIPLERAVEVANIDFTLVENQIASLRGLRGTTVHELTVASPASASAAPVASNARKLMVGVFGLLLFVGAASIAGRDWLALQSAPAAVARGLGLPVLRTCRRTANIPLEPMSIHPPSCAPWLCAFVSSCRMREAPSW